MDGIYPLGKGLAPGLSQTQSNLRACHPLLLSVPFVVSKIASSAVLHEKKGIQRIRAGIPFLRFANQGQQLAVRFNREPVGRRLTPRKVARPRIHKVIAGCAGRQIIRNGRALRSGNRTAGIFD